MARQLEGERRRTGTKFRLFPQAPFDDPDAELEIVWVSPPAGSIGPGPSDDQIYVIDPVGKSLPYGTSPLPDGSPYLPPWQGPIHPPVVPNAVGHFDDLEVGTPEFETAHIYGCIRRTLDVWQGYFGRPIQWHFPRDQLEAVLLPHFDNATAGYGFIEVGSAETEEGKTRPFSLNFDVLAHELGHLIIYGEVGLPNLGTSEGEYYGFHESAADLVAMISVLHFDSVVDRLLERSSGNLYTYNRLNRFAELSDDEQTRVASNPVKLSAFAAGWTDEHDLSEPLTGAMFDILVDVFHEHLLDRGLVSPDVEDLADQLQQRPEYQDVIQEMFDEAYPRDPDGFKDALLAARDYMGVALAESWKRLSPHFLNYSDVAEVLLDVDREITDGEYHRLIVNNFRWRDIGTTTVGPRLSPPGSDSHAFSGRTVIPDPPQRRRPPSYRERWLSARQ